MAGDSVGEGVDRDGELLSGDGEHEIELADGLGDPVDQQRIEAADSFAVSRLREKVARRAG